MIKSEKQDTIDELRYLGVRVFEKREVKVMTDALCNVQGRGGFGSCIKTVDPHTHHHLLIKTFFDKSLHCLLEETKKLFQVQMDGVQRLVGVCVDNCQIISHFAAVTVDDYFKNLVPLSDAAAIFLQVTRTCSRIMEKGFTHNDLHMGNVCVLNGGSGPVATISGFGMACQMPSQVNDSLATKFKAAEIFSLETMMDRLLMPDKKCQQHPLVGGLTRWMDAAIHGYSCPEEHSSLAALQEVLEAILEEVSKATPPGTSVKGKQLVLKRRQDDEGEICDLLISETNESTDQICQEQN